MLKRLQNLWRKETKSMQTPFMFNTQSNVYINNANYDAEYLYQSNVVVYRCISLIAKSISSIEWYLENDKGPVTSSEFDYLLQAPNMMQSKESFLEVLVTNLLLFGNAYVYKVGEYASWKILKSNRVKLQCDAKGMPECYIYNNGNTELKIPIDKKTGRSDLLNIRMFNVDSEYKGMSPCQVIAKVVEFYNQVTEHNISLLKRGARPSGVLYIDPEQAKQENLRAVQEYVKQWSSGPKNTGEMLVLSAKCEWKEMGLKPLDTNFLEGQHSAARQIAQVFGVPPMLIGIQGDATFANYKEARIHFWEDHIIPLMQKICGDITSWFFSDEELKITPALNDIEALMPKRHEAWDRISNVDFLTINEKRERFGYSPIKNGDSIDSIKQDKKT